MAWIRGAIFPMHRTTEIRTLTAVAVRCPKCAVEVPGRDTNPETDIALCRRCSEWFGFAASAGESHEAALDFGNPPAGAWHRLDGSGTELGASTRSSLAFMLVPFGLMSLPVGLPLVVAWALSIGGANWAVGLIGLLALVFSAAVVPMALMTVFGKVRVRADGDQGEVFSGIGPVGRRFRFRWSEPLRIEYKTFAPDGDGKPATPVIEIVTGGRRKWIGALLTEERKRFIYRGLRQLARERGVYL